MDMLVKYDTDGQREQLIRDGVETLFRCMDSSEPLDCRIEMLQQVLKHYETRKKMEATANEVFAAMPWQLQSTVEGYVREWRHVGQMARFSGLPDDWHLPVSWTRNGEDGVDGTEYAVTFSTGETLHYTYEKGGGIRFTETDAYPSNPENPHHDAYEAFMREDARRMYRDEHAGDFHYDPFEDEHNNRWWE